MTSWQDLRDDLRLLSHPPGTAGRDLEEWLAGERKRGAKKAAAKKEAEALHLARTAHGTVMKLKSMLDAHLDPRTSAAQRQLHLAELEYRIVGARKRLANRAHLSSIEVTDAVLELTSALVAAKRYLGAARAFEGAAPTGADLDALRRYRSQAYRPGQAETTSSDRTRPRWR